MSADLNGDNETMRQGDDETLSWGLDEPTLTLLRVFCHEEPGRMDKPWHANGWVYATNGRVLVRVRAKGVWDDVKGAPNVETLFDGPHGTAGAEYDVPVVETAKGDCGRCKGNGWLVCDLGHDHECPDCDGEGERVKFTPEVVTVGDRCFYGRNLWLIRHLPGVKLWIDPSLVNNISVYVAWDGGEGLISSIRKMEGKV